MRYEQTGWTHRTEWEDESETKAAYEHWWTATPHTEVTLYRIYIRAYADTQAEWEACVWSEAQGGIKWHEVPEECTTLEERKAWALAIARMS